MFENVKRGTYAIGNKEIYFRSLWEANYALYLEWLKEQGQIHEWEYEPERYYFIFKEGKKLRSLGNGYLPDFRVWETKQKFYLVEIKGYGQGVQKLKRMKKYHPEIRIELVDKTYYGDLKRKLGKVLHFYT